eukprot:g15259.t1
MGTCVELCAWWRMTAARLLCGGGTCVSPFAPLSLVELDGTSRAVCFGLLDEHGILSYSVGFTLVASVGGEGCTEHRGKCYEFFPAWTAGPSTLLEGALVGQCVPLVVSIWTLGQIYVTLWFMIFGPLDIDKERSLLVGPLGSGTASFIKTFGRQPILDFGAAFRQGAGELMALQHRWVGRHRVLELGNVGPLGCRFGSLMDVTPAFRLDDVFVFFGFGME